MNDNATRPARGLNTGCAQCALSGLCLPRGLSADEQEELSRLVEQPHPLERGEILYRSNEVFRALYVLRVGAVKYVANHNSDEEHILTFGLPGELGGLEGLSSGRYHCTVVALASIWYCRIPYAPLQELAQKIPALQGRLLDLASSEISEERNMAVMVGSRSAEERLATFLYTTGQRMHRRGYSATEFNLVMSRAEVANHLGVAVETVSRLFSRFRRDGLLEAEGRFVRLLDHERIREMVRSCTGGGR